MKTNESSRAFVFGFLGAATFSVLFHAGPVIAQNVKEFIVRLQDSSPGVQQVGNAHISGKMIAGQFQTNGHYARNYGGNLASASPVAYGFVYSNGASQGGSGNFSCSKVGPGTYEVTVDGEAFSSLWAVSIQPVGSTRFAVVTDAGAPFRVTTFNSDFTLSDTSFMFIAYNPTPSMP